MKSMGWFFSVVVVAIVTSGCSMSKIGLRQTAGMAIQMQPVYEREPDLKLAETALAANLKFLEGLVEIDPDNIDLLVATARSFAQYGYGFAESDVLSAEHSGDKMAEAEAGRRVIAIYDRSRLYGLRALSKIDPGFADAASVDMSTFKNRLSLLSMDDLPALYWTAFAWGNQLRLDADRPARLAELSVVYAMMSRVLELDETFRYGGAFLFFGAYYSVLPVFAGGPERARQHFDIAIQISEGRYLLSKLALVEYHYLRTGDTLLAREILAEIVQSDPTILPEQTLANQIAIQRARALLRKLQEPLAIDDSR